MAVIHSQEQHLARKKSVLASPFNNQALSVASYSATVEDILTPDGDVSQSITQTWTDQAMKCHLLQGNCNECSIPKGGYSFTCQMDKVVPALFKALGPPESGRLKKFSTYMHNY
ncbi:MAG: hypothetical protein K2X01_01365 [Cyanobacteria bacterium]|nr:hypothetical protein [Cyanobacteriota bacterium]